MRALLLLLIALPALAEITIVRPNMTLTDLQGLPIEGVTSSTTEVKAMEKASRLPNGDYLLIRPDARISVSNSVVEPPIDPPIEPPPIDPNEPVIPPVDPNEPVTPPAECTVPNCPEAVVTYTPPYPVLGDYAVEGVCSAIHDSAAPTVTLEDGELLISAISRLKELSAVGGIVEIPWNTDTVQCDSTWLGDKDRPAGDLTIKGITGPNGEQPRFYCRSDFFKEGTIPKAQVKGFWLSIPGGIDHSLLVENIHIDGYKYGLQLGQKGNYVIRNNYIHHGPHDGIGSTNTGGGNKDPYEGIEDYSRFNAEICGNEIAFHGQGNGRHGLYMHRSLGGGGDDAKLLSMGGYDTWSEVTFTDNLCHTNNWSSCFKSIANRNRVVHNVFHQKLVTDPSYFYDRRTSQMLVDVSACANNIITGNEFHGYKDTSGEGGSSLVGIRNRKTAQRGCDVPIMWHPYDNTQQPPIKVGPAHTDQWWTDLAGEIFFPTIISNNTFDVVGPYSSRQTAIRMAGTYPVYEVGARSCYLPTPMTWYDRSRTYVSDNTYTGFDDNKWYKVTPRIHTTDKCPVSVQPKGPGPSIDILEIGTGEVYQ